MLQYNMVQELPLHQLLGRCAAGLCLSSPLLLLSLMVSQEPIDLHAIACGLQDIIKACMVVREPVLVVCLLLFLQA